MPGTTTKLWCCFKLWLWLHLSLTVTEINIKKVQKQDNKTETKKRCQCPIVPSTDAAFPLRTDTDGLCFTTVFYLNKVGIMQGQCMLFLPRGNNILRFNFSTVIHYFCFQKSIYVQLRIQLSTFQLSTAIPTFNCNSTFNRDSTFNART